MAQVLKVKVSLFGHLAERAGGSTIALSIAGPSVAQLLDAMKREHPSLPLDGVRVAVNDAYAERTSRFHVDDDLCLIPPVGGG